jgi:hypothetical protein
MNVKGCAVANIYLERVFKTMKILRISDLKFENLSHYLPIMKQISDLSLLAFSCFVSLKKVCRDKGNMKIFMVNRCDLGSHRPQVYQGSLYRKIHVDSQEKCTEMLPE